MAHWLKVREHHLKKIKRKSDRYKNRLQMLLQRTHPSRQHTANGEQAGKQRDINALSTGL